MLLIVALLSSSLPLSQAFTDARVYIQPTTVQYKMAAISFYGIPEQTIPAGGYVKLIVPDEITTYSTGISCLNVGSSKNPCTVRVTSRNQFTIDLTYEIRAGTQFEFKILNAINNPLSEKPSDMFQLLTSMNESKGDSENLRIRATRGSIDRFILTPISQVVGASTQLRVEFTSNHVFPKNGFIIMDFPKWNPNNPLVDSRKTFIQGSESCASIRILSRDLFCEFKDDRLIVQKSATVDIAAGTILEFEVTGFKNPIEADYVNGFQIQTAILFGTNYFVIDEGVTSLTVSQFATLSLPRLSVINTDDPKAGMIQEINEMRLDFYLPVPLNPGCKVKIILPIQYSVDYVKSLTSKMAFGSIRNYTIEQGNLVIDRLERSLSLTEACMEYIENDKVATIEINSLRQPNYEKTTDSVQIIITTKDDYFIANVTEKVTFTPQRGHLQVQTDAVVKIVQDRTQVMFELTPQHAIYVADQPKIHVDFPQELQIQTEQCSISNVSMTGSNIHIAEECVRNRQTFIISNYLAEDYIPAAIGEPPKKIYFTVGYVLNPLSVQTVDGIDVTTYAFGQYAIDEWKGFMGWKLVTGDFINAKVVPSSPITYAFDVFYTISFTPTHLVPQNGYIEIDFPKQIAVPDYSLSQSSCRAIETSAFGTNQITCEFIDGVKLSDPFRLKDPTTPDTFTMRILQAFRRSGVEGGLEYSLVVPGLRNPIQTQPTLSFRFKTFDQADRPIDDKSSGVEISMTQSSILDIVLVTLGSYTNSKLTDYTVTMVPTVPVWDTNLIFITFPTQIQLPANSVDLDCKTVFDKIFLDIKCSYDPNFPVSRSVRVDMTLVPGVKQIDPLDRFAITFNNIRNPATTQTTDSIQVRITTRNSYSIINQKLSGTVITTNNPYSIRNATVKPQTRQPGVESNFILEFYPEHAINRGGGIIVVYPPQTLLGKTQTISADIEIDGILIDQAKLKQSFDFSARALTIQNVFQLTDPYEPKPGDKIRITLHGLKTPFTSAETSSFQMMTFNLVDGTYYYFIDQVQNGLTINSKCNYPCKNCLDTDPSSCESCYPKDPEISNGRPFLQVNTCVEECAVGRYYDAKTDRCELCDPTCLSCVDSAQTCTACGIDKFLFLHEAQCLTSCPDRFIEDQSANRCKACQGNCLTCEGSPTSCTSCDKKSAFPFFFHESCIASCIPDISVQVGDECVECDPKCKTCSGKTKYCTSCESHMKMDPFKNTCEDLCEREVQVYNPLTMQCEKCASTCTKCAGKSSFCTECKKGYLLNFDQTCKETCSSANQIAIDSVCTACSEPCFKCGPSVNTCQSCIPSYNLYLGTKCVQYCPTKYEQKNNVCIYEGLVCPQGFELNSTKDGCIPIKFDCETGYMINEEKTACVPKPGSQLPFPFLLTAVLICFLVLGSYLKDKVFTKVKTNLIACIGALELVMYSIMVGYAYQLDEILILVFTFIGLAGLLASNILFVAYYRQQILQKDLVFAKWIHFFPKTRFWLPLIALLFNFKFGKLLYSGFYGLESTMAKFESHAQFFYLLRLTAYFSFVFCYGFIFIADALIIWRVSWGYQLFVLAIETIVLQLVIIVLTVIEFRQGALALLNNQGDQFAMIKPNQGQARVMGGLDEDDYHEGIPDIDENTLIRSKIKTEELEINLRRQAFARILNQISGHPTEKGVDIKDCFTKFDQERIRQRRCFSMCTSLDSDKSWFADGDERDNKKLQKEVNVKYGNITDEEPRERRYSFPLSPKRVKNLPNTLVFTRQIDDIKKANKDFLINNVYTEAKRTIVDQFVKRKVKTVSRRTQTYLRELLQVEGEEVHESDMEVLIEEEAEIDYGFAKGLIANVIEHISSADESPPQEKKAKKKMKKVFKPKKEIPDFELADIMGDFEIDDMGNFIIMRGDDGELMDQRGRLVNRRGYLIDRFGNVINTLGNIIFKAIELDVDDEIPAPFGFEKRKKNLLKLGDENHFRVESLQKSQTDLEGSHLNLDDEDLLDKEVNGIKERSKETIQKESPTSPTPEELESIPQQQASIKDASHLDKEIMNEEENLEAEIDRLVKKKVPKKRKTLKGGGKFKQLDNLPPKRIRPEDIKELFPHLGIEHDEQRRLAKIASSISGLASQLADKQRQQQLVENRTNSLAQHSQPFDWQYMQEEQKLEQIRQDHLNDIIASSEQAFTEQTHDRPGSNAGSLNIGGLNMVRQMSAAGRPERDRSRLRRNRSSNKPIDQVHDRTHDLQKVYGHTVDLSGFEDKNQTPISHGPPMGHAYRNQAEAQVVSRRGQSGKPGGRMAGLESIYINKMPKLKPPMNMNTSQLSSNKGRYPSATRPNGYNPFRPTLDRFADDPAELNVNTEMSRGLMQGGRDILEIAEKLDRMQRDYLSHNRSGPQMLKNPHTAKNPMPEQNMHTDQDGNFAMHHTIASGGQSHYVHPKISGLQADARTNSGRKRLIANSEANNSIDMARKDNWMPDE